MRNIFKIIFACLLASCFCVASDVTKNYNLSKSDVEIKDYHKSIQFQCSTCHGDIPKENYKPLTTQECMSCHGSYEKLAEKTGHLGYDDNIHASPHYPKMDCNLCHSTHKQTRNYCTMCHSQDSMKNLLVP